MKTANSIPAFLATLIEVYDFTIFPFLIPILAEVFFSSQARNLALNFTILAYVVSYLIKPFGAIAFGYLIDRHGRKRILLLTTSLMTLATSAIGLLPLEFLSMYFGAGLIVCRLIQGLSLSGEFSTAIIMSVEQEKKYPAFAGSFAFLGGSMGLILANLTIFILLYLVPHEQIIQYAWRIPFLVGTVACVILLLIRNKISEPSVLALVPSNFFDLIKIYKNELLTTFSVSCLSASAFYITFIFMPTYLSTLLNLHTNQQSLLMTMFSLLVYLIALPLGGMLADRIGIIRQIKVSSFLYLLFSYLVFAMLPHISKMHCIIVLVFFAFIQAMLNSALPAFIVMQFPVRQRGKALAISYNIALTLFAGLMPYWIFISENQINPGIPISVCAAISLFVLYSKRKRYGYLRSEPLY